MDRSEVRAGNFNIVEIVTTAGSWKVHGLENVLPLGALINRKVRSSVE